MGILNFTKLFTPVEQGLKTKDFANHTVAIDAMEQAYRACLAMKSSNRLSNTFGKTTIHISVIYSIVLRLHGNNVNQIWVFDAPRNEVSDKPDAPDTTYKDDELARRKGIRNRAVERLALLEETDESYEEKKDTLQQQTFRMSTEEINDIKHILDILGVRYCEAMPGYEAEHLCAAMTEFGIADYVMSSDTDAIVYGAERVLRKIKSKSEPRYELYQFDHVLDQYVPPLTHTDLVKISLCLGTDLDKKGIKGIGVKTVFAKYKSVDWDDPKLQKFMDHFLRPYPIKTVKYTNAKTADAFSRDRLLQLIDWLVDENDFSKTRCENTIKKHLGKNIL